MKKPRIGWSGIFLLVIHVLQIAPASDEASVTTDGAYQEISPVVLSICHLWPNSSCLLFTDGRTPGYEALVMEMSKSLEFHGTALFDPSVGGTSANFTVSDRVASVARQVRIHYPCVIVVVSDDRSFLESFAESSLRNRLLSGTSTLIAVGRLRLQDMEALSTHWTFSMHNALVFTPDFEGSHSRWNMYSHLPFTASGSQLVKLGDWQRSRGLVLKEGGGPLLPRKFANMYGATINITVLPYKPYWMEETNAKGEVVSSGSDKLMLDAMQSTLNFSARALNVSTWDEVVQRVIEREAWMASIMHAVYLPRLKRFGFTRTYEHDNSLGFVMAKPDPSPKWQASYYPFANEVWICTLATLLIVCLGLIGVISGSENLREGKKLSCELVILEVFRTLMSQGLNDRLLVTVSTKILLTFWLVFAFIMGATYKGNLMASIVAPRYPPRPETLEELVKVVKRVTMPSYGSTFQELLRNSEADSLRALGNMMELGHDIKEGLRLTLQKRYPHLSSLRFLQYQVAEHYTEADGTSPLYLGREGVMPILYAWPIPHDAPFKEDLDFVILALIEGGIYNKWMTDWQNEAKKSGQQRRRRQLEEDAPLESGTGNFPAETTSDNEPRALTITHFQGPIMLLGFGLVLAVVIFISESFILRYSPSKTRIVKIKPDDQATEK